MNQFAYGWVTPVFAYVMSFLGALLGLACTVRARAARRRRQRITMLVLATWGLGGTGFWVMHFMAFAGFRIGGSPVRFDPGSTIAIFAVAVIVIGAAVFLVGVGRPSSWKVAGGGLLAGLGIVAMHHLGVQAMRVHGPVGMSPELVTMSVIIALATGTGVMWCASTVRSVRATIGAAAMVGLGLCVTHYIAMAAMRVGAQTQADPVDGVGADTFLIPAVLFVVTVLLALGGVFLAVPEAEERRSDLPSAPLPESPGTSARSAEVPDVAGVS